MRLAMWRHVPEATLADLADGAMSDVQLSPWERRHLEMCDRCHGLLEGHRRAGRLLAADWRMVALGEETAAAGSPTRLVVRMGAGQLVRGSQPGWQLQLLPVLTVLLLLVAVGFALWGGSSQVGDPGATPSASPSPSNPPAATATPDRGFAPQHIALDPQGRVYTTDCGRRQVFRIDPRGPVAVAGIRSPGSGFGGDGGPATEAVLECPYGLAFDATGNLHVADTGNNRVRMIDSAGVISTIAGSGPAGWALGGFGGDGGPATGARLRHPAGIAFDAEGNLYIADMANGRIRRVDGNGIITTIAGDGTFYPRFDGDGGPALEATLSDPQGIAVGGDGNIYVADTHNNRVRKIDPSGRITTIAGTGEFASYGDEGPAVEAAVAAPRAVLVDGAGNIYVSEAVWDVLGSAPPVPASVGNRVRRIDADGIIHAFAGTGEIGFAGDGGPATQAQLNGVNENFGLAIDGFGNIYIADSGNHRIRMVDPSGIITTFAVGL